MRLGTKWSAAAQGASQTTTAAWPRLAHTQNSTSGVKEREEPGGKSDGPTDLTTARVHTKTCAHPRNAVWTAQRPAHTYLHSAQPAEQHTMAAAHHSTQASRRHTTPSSRASEGCGAARGMGYTSAVERCVLATHPTAQGCCRVWERKKEKLRQ